jgi:hypothetical protein
MVVGGSHTLHSPSLLRHAFDLGISCLYRRRYCSGRTRPSGCVLWRYGPWKDLMRTLGPARNQAGSRLAPGLRSSNPTLFILTCAFLHNLLLSFSAARTTLKPAAAQQVRHFGLVSEKDEQGSEIFPKAIATRVVCYTPLRSTSLTTWTLWSLPLHQTTLANAATQAQSRTMSTAITKSYPGPLQQPSNAVGMETTLRITCLWDKGQKCRLR